MDESPTRNESSGNAAIRALETVFLRCVVVDAGTAVDSANGRQERICLRRVQVPARGVGAKRPRRFVEPFPRGQREGVAEKQRDGVNRKRGWLHAVGDVELPVWKWLPHLGEREANQRRSVVATERIWLRSPIHVANRRGEAVEVVLRPFVIGDHEFLCRQAARLRAVRRNLRFTVEGQAT